LTRSLAKLVEQIFACGDGFSDVQVHIMVRRFAALRNDDTKLGWIMVRANEAVELRNQGETI
jgi:hypothetical protein